MASVARRVVFRMPMMTQRPTRAERAICVIGESKHAFSSVSAWVVCSFMTAIQPMSWTTLRKAKKRAPLSPKADVVVAIAP